MANLSKSSEKKESAPLGKVPSSRYVLFPLIVILGTVIDLYSKATVFTSLGYPGKTSAWSRSFFGGWMKFRLLTSFNEGALWGIGQGFTAVFAGLSLLAVVGILLWLFYFRAAISAWLTVTLALVMAGTLGNLYDRLGWHGCIIGEKEMFAVRDFLSFTFGTYHYPIFNFADVFLVTGAIMLGLFSFFVEEPKAEKGQDERDQAKAPESKLS